MEYHEIGKTGMKVSSLSFGASSFGGEFSMTLKKKKDWKRCLPPLIWG